MAFGGRIDDRQAGVGKSDGEPGGLCRPDAAVVGPAVFEAAAEIVQQARIDGPAGEVDDTGDTAHDGALLSRRVGNARETGQLPARRVRDTLGGVPRSRS